MSEDRNQKHIAQVQRLQDLILADMERILRDGTATAADRAAILKFLRENGWNVDPAAVPKTLQDMLTTSLKFDDEDDDGVVGKITAAG